MTVYKKRIWASLIILSVVFSIIIYVTGFGEKRLTESEIDALRGEYPICGNNSGIVDFASDLPSTADYKERATTFVHCKVVGDGQSYFKNVTTGQVELDEKRVANGIGRTYEFCTYTFGVIDDSEGIYQKGDEFTLTINLDLMKDLNPQFINGKEFIIPLFIEEVQEDPSYGRTGIMYVTKEGYAISAFTGPLMARAEDPYNGMKADAVLKALKK